MKNFNELLEHELQDLYSAETQITEALPMMIQQVSNDQLRQAFEMHLKETEEQIRRLEQACQMLGCEPEGETCMGMQGLLEEAESLMSEIDDEKLLDAALIGAAQKVEHYEIAGYGTVRTLAQLAGKQDIAQLLEQTLQEEKNTDEKLTRIATDNVNQLAKQA
ncbi:ferritin-like domain-containing protein [Nibrella viscosa]|uniref:Ferritin-like domain-containing protein n=1 Tax=Nibrella viscosa TaxID=1084524 RepID=A0ABP8L1G6_9BACT